MADLYDIKGVEIFATGTHNGNKFTDADLDQMIKNFDNVGFMPPVKDGHHDDKPGTPAMGWIKNIRRVGKKLVADFIDMPKVAYEAIKDRRYDRVSAEIYFKFKKEVGGKWKDLGMVLKAVSLLGAEIPAVKELRPLREVVFGDDYECRVFEPIALFAEWDTAWVNDLPDSAFAVILPGGEKDDDGKTVPRSLRKLPHHGTSVTTGREHNTVDLPHLRNALARLPQTGLTASQKASARSHLEAHAKALNVGNYDDASEEDIAYYVENAKGVSLYVGDLVTADGSKTGKRAIAYVDFDKKIYDLIEAKEWMDEHKVGWCTDAHEDTGTMFRFRMRGDQMFASGSIKKSPLISEEEEYTDANEAKLIVVFESTGELAAYTKSEDGVSFVIGQLKSGNGKMSIQSVVFDKEQWKKVGKCEEWLKEYGLSSASSDPTDRSFRFKQRDPGAFVEGTFKTIQPGSNANRGSDTREDSNTRTANNNDRYGHTEGDMEMSIKQEDLDAAVKAKDAAEAAKKETEDKLAKLSSEMEALKVRADEYSEKTPEMARLHQLQKDLDAANAQLNNQQATFTELEKRNLALLEAQRQDRIKAKVGELKLPALRPHMAAFYDAVTAREMEGKVVRFSDAPGKEPRDTSLETIADCVVRTLNKLADNRFFQETSTVPEFRRDDHVPNEDPSMEVDERIHRYCAKQGWDAVDKYEDAMTAVFNEDPALKKAYTGVK